jgi:hypothetical protein
MMELGGARATLSGVVEREWRGGEPTRSQISRRWHLDILMLSGGLRTRYLTNTSLRSLQHPRWPRRLVKPVHQTYTADTTAHGRPRELTRPRRPIAPHPVCLDPRLHLIPRRSCCPSRAHKPSCRRDRAHSPAHSRNRSSGSTRKETLRDSRHLGSSSRTPKTLGVWVTPRRAFYEGVNNAASHVLS